MGSGSPCEARCTPWACRAEDTGMEWCFFEWCEPIVLSVAVRRMSELGVPVGRGRSRGAPFSTPLYFGVARALHPHQSLPDPSSPPLLSLTPNPSPYQPFREGVLGRDASDITFLTCSPTLILG
eukprot:scaffold1678_cov110-Isochrysis_galbana.AAC.16